MKKKALSIILFMAAMCFALFGQTVDSRAAEGDEIIYTYYDDDIDVTQIEDIGIKVSVDQPFTVGPISNVEMAKVFLFTPQKTGDYYIHTNGSIDFYSEGPSFRIYEKSSYNNTVYESCNTSIDYSVNPNMVYGIEELSSGQTYAIIATNTKTTNSYQMVIESQGDKDATEVDYSGGNYKSDEINNKATTVSLDQVFKVGPISGQYRAKSYLFTPQKTGYYLIHTTETIDLDTQSPRFRLYKEVSETEWDEDHELSYTYFRKTQSNKFDEDSGLRYIDAYLEAGETYAIVATDILSRDAYELIIERKQYELGDKHLNMEDLNNISTLSEGVATKVDNLDQAPGYRVYSFTPEKTGYYAIHTTGTVDLSSNKPKFYLFAGNDGMTLQRKGGSTRNCNLDGHHIYEKLNSDITYYIIATNEKSNKSYGLIAELDLESIDENYSLDHLRNIYKLNLSDSNLVDNVKGFYDGGNWSYCSFTASEDGYYHFYKDEEDEYKESNTYIYVPSGDGKTYKQARGYKYVNLKAGETCYLRYIVNRNTKKFNVSVEKTRYITNMTIKEIGSINKALLKFKNDVGVIVTATYSDGSSKEININHVGWTEIDGTAIKLRPVESEDNLEAGKTSKWYIAAATTSLQKEYRDWYNDFCFAYENESNQTAYLECDINTIGADDFLSGSDYKNMELNKEYSVIDGDIYLVTPSDDLVCKYSLSVPSGIKIDYDDINCYIYDLDSDGSRQYIDFYEPDEEYKLVGGHRYLFSFGFDSEDPIIFTINQIIYKEITDIKVTNKPKFVKVPDGISTCIEEDGYNQIDFEITYEDGSVETASHQYSYGIWYDGFYYNDNHGNLIRPNVTDETFINQGYSSPEGTYTFKMGWLHDRFSALIGSSSETYTFDYLAVDIPEAHFDLDKLETIEVNKAYKIKQGTYQYYKVTANDTGNHLLYTSLDVSYARLYDVDAGKWIDDNYYYFDHPNRNKPLTYSLEKGKDYVLLVEATDNNNIGIDGIFILNYFNGETDPAIATNPNAIPADWEGGVNVDDIIEKIAAIPDNVTLKDKEAVREASETYDRLSDDRIEELDDATKQELLAAKDKLENALIQIAELENEALTLANNVITKANALPATGDLALSDKEAVSAALEAYGQLTEDQINVLDETTRKALTDAKAKIDASQTRIAELEATEEEEIKKAAEEAAQAVVAQITALPDEITLENKEAVEKAIEAYNKLTPEQIALLDEATKQALEAAKAKLDAASATIADLEMTEEDKQKAKEAAQAVVDLITALPDEITLDNKEAVEKAIEAYNKLTPEQIASLDDATKQALEAAKAKLDAAQTKITELEKEEEQKDDQEAAQTAVDAINQIDMDDPASIEAARKAYDALTPEQQKLVDPSIVQALVNAEEEHKVDQAAADEVAEAIQNMDVSNPTSVFEAKKAFDKLTERQRRLIDPALVALLKKAVKAASQIAVKFIKITGISNQIAAGKKIQLTAAITPANASKKKVTWKSGDPKIAKVTQSGLVTIAKKTGGKSVRIAATATDGSKKYATFTIKIMKGAVTKVTVKGAKKTLAVNKTMKLKATVKTTKGKANKKIKWISSNPRYATVSSSGKVKALKAGKGKKVKITAMATDGSGKKKVVTVKIK